MTTASENMWVDFQTKVSSDVVTIGRCWLPMQLLSDVEVTVEARQEMTFLERFAVETLLRMDDVTAQDFLEIASVPPELGRWLLSSLTQKRLAERNGSSYAPIIERCQEALDQSSLPVARTERRDCLWFPETDEVVALPDGGPIQRELRRLHPTGQYPLRPGSASCQRTEILKRALSAGLVHEDSGVTITDMTTVGESSDTCPAYMARVELSPPHGAGSWKVTLIGRKRGKSKSRDAQTTAQAELAIGYLPGTANRLIRKYREAQDSVIVWCREQKGVDVTEDESSIPQIEATKEFLSDVGAARLSNRIAYFGVSVQRQFECEIPFQIAPADSAAERLMEVDSAIRQVLTGDTDQMDERLMSDAVERAWNLRLFKPLYQMRASGDFRI